MSSRPLRSDARRNLERILEAAQHLFADRGTQVSMEEVAQRAGVGVGTLYRRFPTKEALLTALVRERFRDFTAVATAVAAEEVAEHALATLVRRHAEAIAVDGAFQLAMMSTDSFRWEGVEDDKRAFAAVVSEVIGRGQAAGVVRGDLDFEDYATVMAGVTATMHFRPGADWRRAVELALGGLRAP